MDAEPVLRRSDGERDLDRIRRILDGAPAPRLPGLNGLLERVCLTVADSLALVGAAITLLPSTGAHMVAAASGLVARQLEDLQFDAGEGPTGDASRGALPVLVSDLTKQGTGRWPEFARSASAVGVGAVFALPLHLGASRFGALTLYRAGTGALEASDQRAGLIFADLVVELLVDSSLPERDGSAAVAVGRALDGHAHIYQAQGMVMVQLGVTLSEALARMRAHAYARGQDLASLSTDIIEGTTTLVEEAL